MDDSTPIQFLKGAGPARSARLQKLNLLTVGDLIEHYPRAYLDRTRLTSLADITPGETVSATGFIRSVSVRRTRGRMRNLHAILEDGSGVVEAVWFNQPYLTQVLRRGRRILVSGQVEFYRRLQFRNPEFELLEEEAPEESDAENKPGGSEEASAPGIVPVYPLTAGVPQRVMRQLISQATDALLPKMTEFMPPEILSRADLMDWREAHRQVHRPETSERIAPAQRRIAFQELFDLQLLLAVARKRHRAPRTAWKLESEGRLLRGLLGTVPFRPTGAQERVIAQLKEDLAADKPMHRLLEGDVGSGKTFVALAGALLAVEAGAQVAFMVPTEILAHQHGRTFQETAAELGVRVGALTGGMPAREAAAVRERIEAGEIDIVLGTHALIQESVRFHRLGLVIVDEQHRFGVLQRARLFGKGRTPHALVMSATPIPRTLALTLFGDLDLSVLDEKPPGRKPPKTHLVPESRYEGMLVFIGGEIEAGAQAYFVCPMIEASESSDLKAATDLYERLQVHPALSKHAGALLHGRMKSEEKAAVMEAFSAGRIRYLVSTTVIEVGVDVGNASLMVIEHPERFGLSQLHQLRGRVGRGRQPAHLFMIRRDRVGEESLERLEVLVRESDGFRIAEEDLRLRGPGDFFGPQQSGLPPLKMADPIAAPQLLEEARREAFALVAGLGLEELARTRLARRLERRFGERMKLLKVG